MKKIILFILLFLNVNITCQEIIHLPEEIKSVTNILLDMKPSPKFKSRKKITTSQGLVLGGGILFTAGFIGNNYSLKNDWGGPRVFNPFNPHQLSMVVGAVTLTIGITIRL